MFVRGKPILTSKSRQAILAAPDPDTTTLMSSMFFSTTLKPLYIAAAATMAVPCWSSWKTGIFMRSRSFCSTKKHSGALMSSKFMPPKVGSSAAIISTSLSTSFSWISISKTSIFANFLNRTALPSITGLEASGPIFPRPKTAVPLVITPTKLPRAVTAAAIASSSTIASHA